MEFTLIGTWEWFQWVAIRIALFLALLTLGPSIGLILFDVVLYIYRTTFGSVTYVTKHEKEDIRKLAEKTTIIETDVNEFQVAEGTPNTEEGR